MVRRILSLRALFKKLSCMFCAGFSILAPKPSRASKTVLKNGFCIVTPFVGTMPHRIVQCEMILKSISFPMQDDPEIGILPRCEVDADSDEEYGSADAGSD